MTKKTVPPLGQVWAPPLNLVLDDGIIGNASERIKRKAAPDLLERFCHIAEAPDTAAAVVAFAKRWGVLGLCKHGRPYRHWKTPFINMRRIPDCTPGRESFQHWMEFARCFDSMLRIGLDLNQGKPGEHVDWQLATESLHFPISDDIVPTTLNLYASSENAGKRDLAERSRAIEALSAFSDVLPWRFLQSNDKHLEVVHFWKTLPFIDATTQRVLDEIADLQKGVFSTSTISGARSAYMLLVGGLIEESYLQPCFHWSGGVWNIDMDSVGYSNLPAILTAQLMLRVSSAQTQIKCSACPRWFIPKRNQRKYCNSCGIKAAWRAAQRKRRG